MRVLFVSYGGGHIEMCLPVMRALRQLSPAIELRLMALTTAFAVAHDAGEMALGYRDFCDPAEWERIKAYGHQMMRGQSHPSIDTSESLAYLGLNFAELVDELGEEGAWARWHSQGRQGFMPLRFFERVLGRVRPDVVVTTNSPRSEQAAVAVAVELGIPTLSMLDLFALASDPFLRRKIYADRLTVLNEGVKANLVNAGFNADRVFVTGNPAFDVLGTSAARQAGETFRRSMGWEKKNIVLWAGHLEAPDALPHEFAGTGLGRLVQDCLVSWLESRPDVALVIRYHPNEWHRFPVPQGVPRLHWSQPQIEPLLPVLLAADQVIVQGSTVGAQAYFAGKRLINITFSPFVKSTGLDYQALGLADGASDIAMLQQRLDEGLDHRCRELSAAREVPEAATAVAMHILQLVKGHGHGHAG